MLQKDLAAGRWDGSFDFTRLLEAAFSRQSGAADVQVLMQAADSACHVRKDGCGLQTLIDDWSCRTLIGAMLSWSGNLAADGSPTYATDRKLKAASEQDLVNTSPESSLNRSMHVMGINNVSLLCRIQCLLQAPLLPRGPQALLASRLCLHGRKPALQNALVGKLMMVASSSFQSPKRDGASCWHDFCRTVRFAAPSTRLLACAGR